MKKVKKESVVNTLQTNEILRFLLLLNELSENEIITKMQHHEASRYISLNVIKKFKLDINLDNLLSQSIKDI